MKKQFKTLLIILLTTTIYSCSNPEVSTPKETSKPIDELYPIIGRIKLHDTGPYSGKIRGYVIDSCEYIGDVYGGSGNYLTHKGNCKFCIQRSK